MGAREHAAGMLTRLAGVYSSKARAKRARVFHEHMPLTEDDKVLDLGSHDGTHIAELIPQRANVYIADIDPALVEIGRQRYGFTPVVVPEDGHLPFDDGFFDCVFCSSVIEHATVDKDSLRSFETTADFKRAALERQRQLAREIARIGKRYFVQTPNRYFVIESHTWLPLPIVFLPRRLQIKLIDSLNRFWPKTTQPDFNLLTPRQMAELFPGAEIVREKSLGMTKSIMAIRR